MKSASANFIKLKNQRGGALLEFAIMAPLLLITLFGIIEFGLILYNKSVLTNASREGARYGIVLGNSSAGIAGVVENYCNNRLIIFGAFEDPSVSVAFLTDETTPSNPNLEVQVTWEYRFLAFPALSGLGVVDNALMLSAITVMKVM